MSNFYDNPSVSMTSSASSTPSRLQIDLEDLNKKKEYVCNSCKRNFGKRKKDRDAHFIKCKKYFKYVIIESGGVTKCGLCETSSLYNSTSKVFQHIEKKHGSYVAEQMKDSDPVKCPQCRAHIVKKAMNSHYKICMKYKGLVLGDKCTVCNKEFSNRQTLLKHVGKNHGELLNTSDEPFENPKVETPKKATPSRSGQKPRCVDCQVMFGSQAELWDHKQTCRGQETPKNDDDQEQCTYCSRSVSKKVLRQHLERCLKASEFIANGNKCIACQKVHDSRKAVYIHVLRTHRKDLNELDGDENDDEESIGEFDEPPQENNNVPPRSQPLPKIMPSRQKPDTPKYPLKVYSPPARLQSSTVNATGDPNVVTKLYTCPFCQQKLAFYDHAQNHVIKYHQIPIENMRRLGLDFIEQLL